MIGGNSKQDMSHSTPLRSIAGLQVIDGVVRHPVGRCDTSIDSHQQKDRTQALTEVPAVALPELEIDSPSLRKQQVNMRAGQSSNDYLSIGFHTLLFGGITIGLTVMNMPIDSWLVLGYAAAVIALRMTSYYVFASALFTLAMVPTMTVLSTNELAEAYAVCSFFLLVLATVLATVELLIHDNSETQGFDWPKI